MCGEGIGFGDHCAYIYTAEMAPPKWRGRLNTLVQLGTISGIVVANAINIATNSLLWGWRLSLGLAVVPGLVLVLGKHFSVHFCSWTLILAAIRSPIKPIITISIVTKVANITHDRNDDERDSIHISMQIDKSQKCQSTSQLVSY